MFERSRPAVWFVEERRVVAVAVCLLAAFGPATAPSQLHFLIGSQTSGRPPWAAGRRRRIER